MASHLSALYTLSCVAVVSVFVLERKYIAIVNSINLVSGRIVVLVSLAKCSHSPRKPQWNFENTFSFPII